MSLKREPWGARRQHVHMVWQVKWGGIAKAFHKPEQPLENFHKVQQFKYPYAFRDSINTIA